MEDSRQCNACGRSVEAPDGPICLACGALVAPAQTETGQAAALQRYHFLLASKNTADMDRALKAGFLPTYPAVLMDAGVLLAPFLEDHPCAAAASERLKIIVARLSLCPDSPGKDRAVKELVALLNKQEKAAERDARLGCVMLSVLSIVLALAGWFAVSSLMVYLENRDEPKAPAPAGKSN